MILCWLSIHGDATHLAREDWRRTLCGKPVTEGWTRGQGGPWCQVCVGVYYKRPHNDATPRARGAWQAESFMQGDDSAEEEYPVRWRKPSPNGRAATTRQTVGRSR